MHSSLVGICYFVRNQSFLTLLRGMSLLVILLRGVEQVSLVIGCRSLDP
jgi:hypothetical protein